MQVEYLMAGSVCLIHPKVYSDPRGCFVETYSRQHLLDVGIRGEFVQDNHSISQPRGTVRGLHFQRPPFAQAKLIRVVRGSIFDVAVDLRQGSPTFGQHVSAILSAENWTQLYIPEGFAHGLCTLEPDTEVVYKVAAPYSPAHEGGVLWNDPALGIKWPVAADEAVLSDKDRILPLVRDLGLVFPSGEVGVLA